MNNQINLDAIKIINRKGKIVDFDISKINNAISSAMKNTEIGIVDNDIHKITTNIINCITNISNTISINELQDIVEKELFKSGRFDTMKEYIIYRYNKDKLRKKNNKSSRLLSDEFISKYKHIEPPMTDLGKFVYLRTYSRWKPLENRREYWWETVKRAVEYNCSLVKTSVKEAEELFDNIFNLRQFLSGRTFWVGGTEVSKKFPCANYNCAFEVIDNFNAFKDLFYLLMVGSGVGVRILKSDINKLPKVRTNYRLINEDYTPVEKNKRENNTSLKFINNDTATIIVGDSKEGWTQSLKFFFDILTLSNYRDIKTIIINYNNVRGKGERLKTFGGTASGHKSLKNMFLKIDKLIHKYNSNEKIKFKPIDCLDIANIIGENVVVGGVRRTAEIILIDSDDTECIEAKNNLYINEDGKWKINKAIEHRQMSNNSIYYKQKPSRNQLHWQLEQMRYSGEPGWVNEEAGAKRRSNMNGVNPCGEILLDSKGLCNLTTINVMAFVENGILIRERLFNAQKLSVRAGYRMTNIELELNDWDVIQSRDRLLGCSLTGWQDMVNSTKMTMEEQGILLKELKDIAKEENYNYAKQLGKEPSLLVTTIKPEGTLSQLPTVSSGIHYSHSPYFIRRVRINSNDPLVKVCEKLKYPIYPEVGQSSIDCSTKVIEFPCKSPDGITKYDISAIEQLENYKMFMTNYVDHNCSITVHVKCDEWDDVEEWVWNEWDNIVAISFLSLNDNFYKLMPYESIDKETYDKRINDILPFNTKLLQNYEKKEKDLDIGNEGCENGICPIR